MTTHPPVPPANLRDAGNILRAWQRAAGRWAPYVWPTLLTASRSPNSRHHDEQAESNAASWVDEFCTALAHDVSPAGQAWRSGAALVFADLPALVALASGPCLASRGIRPVAVLRRWPSLNGLLPSSPLVDAYQRYAPGLAVLGAARGAVWLVESERLLPLPVSPWEPPEALRTHLDNRYTLDAQDLPFASRLRAAGVTTILGLTSEAHQAVAPDLARYYRDLANQGFAIVLLPLRSLDRVAAETRS